MDIVKFREMEEGKTYDTFVLVKGLSERETKNGDSFVSVELFDGQKMVRSNIFDKTVSELESDGIDNGTILHISLSVVSRDGNTFYNLNNWQICDSPAISKLSFACMAPIDLDKSYEWLLDKIRAVDSNPDNIGPYKSESVNKFL